MDELECHIKLSGLRLQKKDDEEIYWITGQTEIIESNKVRKREEKSLTKSIAKEEIKNQTKVHKFTDFDPLNSN